VAYTYKWADLIGVLSSYIKGVPISKFSPQICDFISQEMYVEYPWKQTITNTANGMIPLIDSVQDYPVAAPNILRPLKAEIVRTDVTPQYHRELSIVRDLGVDLYPRAFPGITQVSMQQAIGLFRLSSAVNVPTGMMLELRMDYQIDPIKITDLNQTIWFQDHYAVVALEGLLYWGYKFSDDTRVGSAQTDAFGRIIGYTGQMGTYKAALNRMKMAEDFGFTDSVFPSEPMGVPRDQNGLQIYGWP
jgi:hypothetical protein